MVNDSREVLANDIFCAVQGHDLDGRAYIEAAIKQGAALIIAQCQTSSEHGNIAYFPNSQITVVEFYQLDQHLFDLASHYYLQPQKNMRIIGITGTNGKTTTSQIIASLLEADKQTCAVIGTVGAGQLSALTPINNTTPGATQLLSLLAQFTAQNVDHVAMEVSSHALVQRRVDNNLFDISVFTNLSRDHLDYHKTMAEYAEAKFKIFSGHAKQVAIVNGDDSTAQNWLEQGFSNQPVIVYGKSAAIKNYQQYLCAENIQLNHSGVVFTATTPDESIEINSPLLGGFNVDNLLAAMAVLLAEKVSLKAIAKAVSKIQAISGRMEAFAADNQATIVVDYAHTPDALINALTACRQHCDGVLWVVFGCGGNRDKGKRALMGQAAEQYADHVVITNDNPRNEDPMAIAQNILSGCDKPENITIELDREHAVRNIVKQAKAQDVVLLAGKGHEKNIIIGEQTLPYDERALVGSIYHNEVAS